MKKIAYLNPISEKGTALWTEDYQKVENIAEAEAIKQDYARHKEILPVVRPTIEKMATIVKKYVDPSQIDTIYLCGGTTCLTGIETVFEKVTGIRTIKPANPFLVTPAGIAMNCILSE